MLTSNREVNECKPLLDGRTAAPRPSTSAYIFPGFGLGLILSESTRVVTHGQCSPRHQPLIEPSFLELTSYNVACSPRHVITRTLNPRFLS
jgi:hypothetical protein